MKMLIKEKKNVHFVEDIIDKGEKMSSHPLLPISAIYIKQKFNRDMLKIKNSCQIQLYHGSYKIFEFHLI